MFHTIVTHERPHLDEIVAIWLLRKFGEQMFPGIDTAKVVFWKTGGVTPDGRTAEEYEADGVLLVGVGGGQFDEHPTTNGERKQGDCAATLIAKAIGVEDDPALELLLKYVVDNDTKGAGHPLDIAHLATLLHQRYPNNPEKVMEWVTEGIEAKYREQYEFWTLTREEYERVAEVEEVWGPDGRTLTMVTVVSDSEQMSKFARFRGAAVVIQKRSSGNVQIFTNKRFGLVLYDVAQMLRLAEQETKSNVVTTDWKTLAAEGKVEGAEEWFFHEKLQALLNGSSTAKDVPPTRLTLDIIKEVVRIGINPDVFEASRAPDCRRGICTATASDPCSWYSWGLHRCRKIRYEMKQN